MRTEQTAGITRMELAEMETTEARFSGPEMSVSYVQKTYEAHRWRCDSCGLVWDKKHDARECASRSHRPEYKRTYGGGNENGKHIGGTVYITTAVRREKV